MGITIARAGTNIDLCQARAASVPRGTNKRPSVIDNASIPPWIRGKIIRPHIAANAPARTDPRAYWTAVEYAWCPKRANRMTEIVVNVIISGPFGHAVAIQKVAAAPIAKTVGTESRKDGPKSE